MPTSTVENYVKQIYLEQLNGQAGSLVSMGRLAAAMGVVPGTATSMMKALADAGLVEYEPRGGARELQREIGLMAAEHVDGEMARLLKDRQRLRVQAETPQHERRSQRDGSEGAGRARGQDRTVASGAGGGVLTGPVPSTSSARSRSRFRSNGLLTRYCSSRPPTVTSRSAQRGSDSRSACTKGCPDGAASVASAMIRS